MTGVIREAGLREDNCSRTAMKPKMQRPTNPERVCWGCDKLCPAQSLACGNGTIRTPHPVELFGDDWLEWCEQRGKPDIDSSGA
jgi:hypothetical protein